MKAIQEDIVNILSTDSTLQTLLGGTSGDRRVKPVIPNEPDENPLIVYKEVLNEARTVPRNAQDVTLQFELYATTQSLVEDIFTRVDFLLNYYKKINQPQICYMRRSMGTDEPETDRNMRLKVIRYRIWSINS